MNDKKTSSNNLEGVWIVTVSPQGHPTFTDMVAIHSDGSVTINESDGRLGIGVWEKVSDARYAVTAWEYWKAEETFFQGKLNSSVELGGGGDEYRDTFTFQIFMAGNPNPIQQFSGTGTGVRMSMK